MCNLTLYYSSVATEGEGEREGGGSKRTAVFTRAVKSLGTARADAGVTRGSNFENMAVAI